MIFLKKITGGGGRGESPHLNFIDKKPLSFENYKLRSGLATS
jgi:hypothetical protein